MDHVRASAFRKVHPRSCLDEPVGGRLQFFEGSLATLQTGPDALSTSSFSASSFRLESTNAAATFRKATVDLLRSYQNTNSDFRFPDSVPRRCLTKPSKPEYNHCYDNRNHDYILYVNDLLFDDHGNQYIVLDLLGTGTFGQVVKCRHSPTNEIVAVKVIKNQRAYFHQAWVEISILRILHRNRCEEDTKHIVRFKSHFIFRGHLCLVFEKLSINLYEFLKQNNYAGVSLEMLRHFLTQLLQALNVLARSEVIHCDLKPENILLKNFDTAELKVIDFGSACQSEHPVYSYVQSRFYRSPEVILGLPQYDSKIDMWSLGCVAGELFLGIPLFPGQNEMNMVSRIVEMLGPMPDMFLCRCRHTQKFFNVNRLSEKSRDVRMYELKTADQYELENGVKLPEWKRYFREQRLEDIITSYPFRTPAPYTEELALRRSFVDLLSRMLKVDPLERLSPAEAMEHPFIRVGPLPDGQPWQPPTRARRMPRARPIPIEASHDTRDEDGLYSSSAPALRGRGRSMQGMHSATEQAMMGHSDSISNPAYCGGRSNVRGLGSTISVGSDAFGLSSTFSLYGNGSGRSSFAGPSSYEPRTFALPANVFPVTTVPGNRSMANSRQSPGGCSGVQSIPFQRSDDPSSLHSFVHETSPSSVSAGGRRGSMLHTSSSKESLSAPLRLSASRESLGLGRVSSSQDLGEETLSPFALDEEITDIAPVQSVEVNQTASTSNSLPLSLTRTSGASHHEPPAFAALPGYGFGLSPKQHSRPSNVVSGYQQIESQSPSVFMTDGEVSCPPNASAPTRINENGGPCVRKPPQPHPPHENIQSPRSRNPSSKSSYG